jgi:hypothetical protein
MSLHGLTVPPSAELIRRMSRAAQLCGLVCFNANEDAKLSLFSSLQDLALAQPEDTRESIINQFGDAAMGGRRDGVVLEFPIIIDNEAKPQNIIKRSRLRGNLEGQWIYLVEKTLKALLPLSWLDCQGPMTFAEKVQIRIDWLHIATGTEVPHPPDGLAVPDLSVGPHSLAVPDLSVDELRRYFYVMVDGVLTLNHVDTDTLWGFVRPFMVPADVHVVDADENLSDLTDSPQRAAAAAAAQVANE